MSEDDTHLRDFYAGLAMLGWLSAGNPASYPEGTAEIAFDMAEAMMKERIKRKETKDEPA
jgi:hypothetical protein